MKMLIAPSLLLATALTGCSVTKQTVEAQPPVINKPVSTFSSSQGVLEADSASIFFWPAEWSEEQTVNGVKSVKQASKQLLGLSAKMKLSGFKIEAEFAKFMLDQCVAKFAVLEDGKTPEQHQEADPVQWKGAPDIDPTDAAFAACVKNYETRNFLRAEIGRIQTEDLGKVVGVIDATIGPENKVPVSANGTQISIFEDAEGQVAVSITLKRFLFNKYSPSTEIEDGPAKIFNVKYDTTLNRITFMVNELNRDMSPTGVVYYFALTRLPDLYTIPGTTIDYALFQGDVAVLEGEEIKRKGSVSISGNFIRQ